MENHYPASSNDPMGFDDDTPENLDTLSPGQVPTPVRIGKQGRVATSISVTELPIPTIYTKADTASKREAFRRTNHAMLHHPIVDDERGDRMDRIAASLNRSMHRPHQPQYTHMITPEEGEARRSAAWTHDLLLLAGLGLLGGVGLYLAYRGVKYMFAAEAAVLAAAPVVPT